MIAAVQHCICAAMRDTVFLKLGPYAGLKFCSVAEALCESDRSHESIWRLMTVTALLKDKTMVEHCKKELCEVAENLIMSWNSFPGPSRVKENCESLAQFFFDSAMIYLELQKGQKSIRVSVDVVSQYFDSDSEDDAHEVPGGFQLPDSTLPVLCMFPAFLWDSANTSSQPALIRKGTAMFRDSPPLLAALSQETEVTSSTLKNRSAR
jgi:hypothetical protein